MHQKSTELISAFVKTYIDQDATIGNKINHFDHKPSLILIDEQMDKKTCEACAIPISAPFYGCSCGYFLHKCCAELPRQIIHPSHPGHQLTLKGTLAIRGDIYNCNICYQRFNGFYYSCSEGEKFRIDIKCASLIGPVYHEAHIHPLTPRFISSSNCSACGFTRNSECILQCNTCSFNLCFMCAMAPPVMKHRYGKSHPFILTYYPPENHYDEYICEICEMRLFPKQWFYHCVFADQFTHLGCMIQCGADSNIKYGKSNKYYVHKHKLTTISCTYDCSPCSYCGEPLRTGFSVGFECIPCKFRIHLDCVNPMSKEQKRSATVTISN